MIVAYVSGHGFGHFTRSAPVLERLADLGVHLRTGHRALRLARDARRFLSVEDVDVGPGVVQRGPLAVDLAATRDALAAHLADLPRLAREEAAFLRQVGARAVFSDVAPLGFAAAEAAGLPSVGMSNFSWSWIYRGYAGDDPAFAAMADALAAVESRCTLFLALAMGGGLDHFPRRRSIGAVVRPPTASREAIRARLFPVDDRRPIVLTSFGGFGDEIDLSRALGDRHGCRVLVVSAPVSGCSDDLRAVAPSEALPHQDLVYAADCVIGKPGYGTVAECLHRPTPFVYTERGAFAEYAPLVDAIERFLPCAHLTTDQLAAGRWGEAVRRAIASAPREPAPPATGVDEAEAAIRTLIE